ncbi:hypothetical protein EDB87DRAFT_1170490 [Lactarius vividus]|nr:hypothetical protein EDB87DRAFT_1170490 [Lactarius vividus]
MDQKKTLLEWSATWRPCILMAAQREDQTRRTQAMIPCPPILTSSPPPEVQFRNHRDGVPRALQTGFQVQRCRDILTFLKLLCAYTYCTGGTVLPAPELSYQCSSGGAGPQAPNRIYAVLLFVVFTLCSWTASGYRRPVV